jgi:Rod binding domain-containing protein
VNTQFSLGTPAVTNQDLDQAKSAQALRALKGQGQKTEAGKIDKAARDFESILLGEWLEKAEKSFATVPGSSPSDNTDPGHDQFQSIGCQFLGGALAKAGGIGIASMISKHLKATEADRAAAQAASHEGNQGNQIRAGGASLSRSQANDQ